MGVKALSQLGLLTAAAALAACRCVHCWCLRRRAYCCCLKPLPGPSRSSATSSLSATLDTQACSGLEGGRQRHISAGGGHDHGL